MAQISLAQQALLSDNAAFRSRVKAAMIIGASNINSEAVANGGQGPLTYAARHDLATKVINGADPFLDRFAWAVAANAGVATASLHAPVSVAKTFAVNPCVVQVVGTHGLSNGDTVEIDGALDPTVNGTWVVTIQDGTFFTIPVLGVTDQQAKPAGAVTKQCADSDLNTAIASVWNAIAGVGVTTTN